MAKWSISNFEPTFENPKLIKQPFLEPFGQPPKEMDQ